MQHLKTLTPLLPRDVQTELDALWTIAREQLSNEAQARAHELMTRNNQGHITADEMAELERLSEQANRLNVRKAEAASILRQREYTFTQEDFMASDE